MPTVLNCLKETEAREVSMLTSCPVSQPVAGPKNICSPSSYPDFSGVDDREDYSGKEYSLMQRNTSCEGLCGVFFLSELGESYFFSSVLLQAGPWIDSAQQISF